MKTPNYLNLYQSTYKKIPNYVFWLTLIPSILAILFSAIMILVDEEAFLPAFAMVVFGIPLSIGIAFLDRWIASLVLCQKIVATDALLSINSKNNATPANVDNLPKV